MKCNKQEQDWKARYFLQLKDGYQYGIFAEYFLMYGTY